MEKESEYKDFVQKINNNRYGKVNIIIDIDDVKKKCPVDVSTSFSLDFFLMRFAQPDVLVDNDNLQVLDPAATPEGATALDLSLARFRSMLEKKYGSDNKPGHYVYICADNTELPLTPFMMHQWAIALVSSIL